MAEILWYLKKYQSISGSTLRPVCPCMLFCRMSFLFGLRVDLWLVLSSARLLIHYREVTNGKVCALILHNDSD
jgi:hypothetical protein